ncbi:VanZ family protein [Aquabacterium humicola]|uniref:VanZ family protein n=1 Tax=Aquabacterium humicola TaxID=3237377 RepID=UPI00254357A4|nr:VanZ family protein [Rubrivivax pictus]
MTALRALALLCVALVVHGSLYPWRFASPPSFGGALAAMLADRHWWTGRGDVIGNIVLFVPLAAIGQLALRESRWTPGLGAVVVLSGGTVLAFALQVLQIAVPARNAALSDVLWNAVGLALGLAIAASIEPLRRVGARWHPAGRGPARTESLALALALLWLALQWWPFVPTLDWQHVKEALKPLAPSTARWSWPGFVDTALALAVLGPLLRANPARGPGLVALCGLAALGKLLIVYQALTPQFVGGCLMGLACCAAGWRAGDRPVRWLTVAAALAWYTFDELRPFRWTELGRPFQWLPFVASLQGSMLSNLLSLCWNLYWLGAVLLLATGLTRHAGAATCALVAWVLMLEGLQTHLPGRTPDVTPALLPVFWWLAHRAASRHAPLMR